MTKPIKSAGTFLLRWSLLSTLFVLPYTALAADMVLNDLKAQNGVQLSTDELKQLLPNAKVVSYYQASTRRWNNKSNGKFTASSDARKHDAIGKSVSGQGTWHIGDNGTFFITIEWPRRTENWCKYIFKVDEKYYGVNSVVDGSAEANEFEFSK
ncbi:MAG: DUF995 domain-containing protein [Candidatus Thiodiazotropha sp.]